MKKEAIVAKLVNHREIKSMGFVTPCWLWTGGISSSGYGSICVDKKYYGVHTIAARVWLKDFSYFLQVLHKCNVRLCFNPDHIYMGTPRDNIIDMINAGNHNMARKTHCKHGHEFTPENTRIYKGKRACKICLKIARRWHYSLNLFK